MRSISMFLTIWRIYPEKKKRSSFQGIPMLGPYNAMWVFVGFDMPTKTKTDMKRANRFRNDLLELGFSRYQLSFYVYYVPSKQRAETVADAVERKVPPNGKVSIFFITDRQFGMTRSFFGGQQISEDPPEQGLLFE
ncbi:MAG: CRISPR-associated endonuclease Cas2 [Sphaerochaeta sp.]